MYKIISVLMDGLTIKGYRVLETDTNKEINISVETFEEHAREGLIDGVEVIKDGDKEYITGVKYSRLRRDSVNGLEITGKIEDNGEVTGYSLSNGKNITKNKAWNIGVNNGIKNGKSYYSKGIDGSVKKYFQFVE